MYARDYSSEWSHQNLQYHQGYPINDGRQELGKYDTNYPPPERIEVGYRDQMWGQVETMDEIGPMVPAEMLYKNTSNQPRPAASAPKHSEKYFPEVPRPQSRTVSSSLNMPPPRETHKPPPPMFIHVDSEDDIAEPPRQAHVPSRPASSRTISTPISAKPEPENLFRTQSEFSKPAPKFYPPIRKKEEPVVSKDPEDEKAEQFVNQFFPTRIKQDDLKRAPVIPEGVPDHVARLLAETGLDQEAFVPNAWEHTTEPLTDEICRYTITEYGNLGVPFSDFLVTDPKDLFFYRADPFSGEPIATEEEKYMKLIQKYELEDCREITRVMREEIERQEEDGRVEYERRGAGK